mmetsp:Transcript_67632/g.180007  ORF Transcript_67632/g.180007 Transcript_67632/m.180007 type:complete len:247 (-) Transcript_67632:987-1727(-)
MHQDPARVGGGVVPCKEQGIVLGDGWAAFAHHLLHWTPSKWVQVEEEHRPREEVHGVHDNADEYQCQTQQGHERLVRLGILGIGAPVQADYLHVWAHVVGGPEERFHAIKRHRVHTTLRKLPREKIGGRGKKQRLGTKELRGNGEGLAHKVLDHRGSNVVLTVAWQQLLLVPVCVVDVRPYVEVELLAVVGVLEANLIERPREGPRAGLGEAGNHDLDARLVSRQRGVLARDAAVLHVLPELRHVE